VYLYTKIQHAKPSVFLLEASQPAVQHLTIMSPQEAQTILQALVIGVDPETGEILSETSPFNNIKVVRALYLAMHAIGSKLPKTEKHKKDHPEHNGKPWTEEEDKDLVAAFKAAAPNGQIELRHKRSSGGIAARLVKLGLLEDRGEYRARAK